jgi:hypothetical protein
MGEQPPGDQRRLPARLAGRCRSNVGAGLSAKPAMPPFANGHIAVRPEGKSRGSKDTLIIFCAARGPVPHPVPCRAFRCRAYIAQPPCTPKCGSATIFSFDVGLRHALTNGHPVNEVRAGLTFAFPLGSWVVTHRNPDDSNIARSQRDLQQGAAFIRRSKIA